jgi:hypothetical protein
MPMQPDDEPRVLELFATLDRELASHAKSIVFCALRDIEEIMTRRIDRLFNSGRALSVDQALTVRKIIRHWAEVWAGDAATGEAEADFYRGLLDQMAAEDVELGAKAARELRKMGYFAERTH